MSPTLRALSGAASHGTTTCQASRILRTAALWQWGDNSALQYVVWHACCAVRTRLDASINPCQVSEIGYRLQLAALFLNSQWRWHTALGLLHKQGWPLHLGTGRSARPRSTQDDGALIFFLGENRLAMMHTAYRNEIRGVATFSHELAFHTSTAG